MLDFMRRNARSWGIKIAFGIISLTMVFFLGGGAGLSGASRPLAKVGDRQVTLTDFQLAQNRNEAYFRSQFGGQIPAEMRSALDIPGMTLRQLVDAAALSEEAERLGLRITDEAVADAIREIDAFHVNGSFSPSRYRDILNAQGLSPARFEEQMREELLTTQLTELVKVGVHVFEDEAWEAYKRDNRTVTLAYLSIGAEDFESEVTVDEDGLGTFFEDHREDYRRPETVRVRYLAYTPEAFAAGVDVSDEEIEEHYELNAETEFTREEEVTARHILKKVDADASEEDKDAARTALQAAIDRVEAGEDFAEVAKEESEDPGSGARGGDLGSFGRGRMVKPFEEAAFALGVGERSGIVESSFGFHYIEVTAKQEAGTQELSEVRDQIRDAIAKRKAADTVFDAAASDAAAALDGTKLDVIAEERDLEFSETPLLSKGAIVPGIGAAPNFVDAAFDLDEAGDVSDSVKVVTAITSSSWSSGSRATSPNSPKPATKPRRPTAPISPSQPPAKQPTRCSPRRVAARPWTPSPRNARRSSRRPSPSPRTRASSPVSA
jgi:peptidyl-prolyl cis-trans isomerase D